MGTQGQFQKRSGHLSFLVLIVAAGTKRRTQFVFILSQPFDHHSGDAEIDTEKGVRVFGILLREVPHGFQAFLGGLSRLSVGVHGTAQRNNDKLTLRFYN